jgi:hypothetical protein
VFLCNLGLGLLSHGVFPVEETTTVVVVNPASSSTCCCSPYGTRECILSARIVRLHVLLEVVAAAKQLATFFDVRLEFCIFLSSEYPTLSVVDDSARDASLLMKSDRSLLLVLGSPIV